MTNVPEWGSYLAALLLLLVRISGVMVFAPFLSADAIPARVKAMFTLALAWVVAPVAASARAVSAGPVAIAGELGVGMMLGVSLLLLQEAAAFAGQVIGIELSFSLANVLDPTSKVETPLISHMMNLMFLLVAFAAGLDRLLLGALFRTLAVVPLGHVVWTRAEAASLLPMASGIFLAGLQLAAPVVAACFLVELTVALAGRVAPSLPVLIVGIPIKSFAGYAVLLASMGVWPRFVEARWSRLLDCAMHLLVHSNATAAAGG